MAYLNNEYVTVDAVLTTKGRELLARNDGSFRITQFSLSEDEIDYTIYRMECNFRFFQGSLPFQFLISTSLVYKYIKINLTPQEERFRDLPF